MDLFLRSSVVPSIFQEGCNKPENRIDTCSSCKNVTSQYCPRRDSEYLKPFIFVSLHIWRHIYSLKQLNKGNAASRLHKKHTYHVTVTVLAMFIELMQKVLDILSLMRFFQ